jgi:hypothetical protein
MANANTLGVTWAQALSAIGTTGAVIVALFVHVVRTYWNRPKLRLTFDDGDESTGRRGAVRSFVAQGHPECWVALTVTNVGKHDVAEEVEVFVEVIDSRRDLEVENGKEYQPFPRCPIWSLKWRDREDHALNIPSRMSRRLDLVVVAPDRLDPPGLHVVMVNRLGITKEPHDRDDLGSTYLDPRGHYTIRLAICAKNSRAERYSVSVCGGEVCPDAVTNHEKLRTQVTVSYPVALISCARRAVRRVAREHNILRRI